MGGEGRGFGDVQLGPGVAALDAHGQIGQHDGQETPGPVEGVGQGRGAEHAAAQELETARAHAAREQPEAFVIEGGDDPVVEGRVAVDRHPAGRVCKIDVEPGKVRGRVDIATQHSGKHSGNETH